MPRRLRTTLAVAGLTAGTLALAAPAASAQPDLCVAANGAVRVDFDGPATCGSGDGKGNVAIARDGGRAVAGLVEGDDRNRATATGELAFAVAADGDGNTATATGDAALASAVNGDGNTATATGDGAGASTGLGDGNTATATGDNATASAVFGSSNTATATGDNATADAFGSNNTATATGDNATARAIGASNTATATGACTAEAIGDDQTAVCP